jgi:excisionase family DNA binding protein
MASQPDDKRFFDYAAASQYTSMSQQTLRRFVNAGKLTPHRPSGYKVLFTREQLDELVLGSHEAAR